MKASVIFSTYNSEEWLEKVIWGFSVQTTKDFEIIIADDGSREATKNLIEKYKTELDIPIIHVWQERKYHLSFVTIVFCLRFAVWFGQRFFRRFF